MMGQIEDILNKQIVEATLLLERAAAIPDGSPSIHLAGFIQYDEALTRPLSQDTDSWETETLEYLRVLYGEGSRQAADFQECTRPKNYYRKFREELQDEIKRCVSFLQALIKADMIKQQMSPSTNGTKTRKTPMVFISHSSLDKEFVEALVTLLESMGFDNTTLFCSSVPDFWIGLSQNIFESLRSLFSEHELYVIFIQSPRYYKSAVSLNEMGAAWVLRNDSCSILTKDMTRDRMQGVVNSSTIYIKVDTPEAGPYLNELKKTLSKLFNLAPMTDTTWERKRNTFLKAVNAIDYLEESSVIPTPWDDEYKRLLVEELKQKAIEKRQAKIRGNIIEGRSRGTRILKIFNAGQSKAKSVTVEWLNPENSVMVQWEFGLLGEISPQSSRSINMALCEGHSDTMRLRYTWSDDNDENNTYEEDVQI